MLAPPEDQPHLVLFSLREKVAAKQTEEFAPMHRPERIAESPLTRPFGRPSPARGEGKTGPAFWLLGTVRRR
jgi:hypothetical protein